MAVPGIIRFIFTAASATTGSSEIIWLQSSRRLVQSLPGALGSVFVHAMQPSLQRLSIEDTLSQGPRSPLRSVRSEEHTSELQSLMRISYAVFCLKKKKYIT